MSTPSTSHHRSAKTSARIALKVHDNLARLHLQKQSSLCDETQYLQSITRQLETLSRRINKARTRGWLAALHWLHAQWDRLTRDLANRCQHLNTGSDRSCEWTPPPPRQIFEDLDQLTRDMGEWNYDSRNRTLSVVTEPITLEGVTLGPFRIELYLDNLHELDRYPPYQVKALEPNPPESSSCVTHPHVSDDHMCEGDATSPIRQALREGRLTDFFLIVNAVLNTYNPQSPYVPLDQWQGEPCYDCGHRMDDEDCRGCEQCGHDFCLDCVGSCSDCDETICLDCLTRCPTCEQLFCNRCLGTCNQCEHRHCRECLTEHEGTCPDCYDLQQQEHEQQGDDNDHESEPTTPPESPPPDEPADECPEVTSTDTAGTAA